MKIIVLSLMLASPVARALDFTPRCDKPDAYYITLLEAEIGADCEKDRIVKRDEKGFVEASCEITGYPMSQKFACE